MIRSRLPQNSPGTWCARATAKAKECVGFVRLWGSLSERSALHGRPMQQGVRYRGTRFL